MGLVAVVAELGLAYQASILMGSDHRSPATNKTIIFRLTKKYTAVESLLTYGSNQSMLSS